MKNARIAVCKNVNGWHERFMDSLSALVTENSNLTCHLVNIDADNWIAQLADFDVVIWKPNHMGIESASYFKEKIYIIEKYLGKTVIPNFNTVWHFESKVAQKYLMEIFGIPTPRSVATFDYQDALKRLQEFSMPVVFKKSTGAASTNVKLIRSYDIALSIIKNIFCKQAANQVKKEKGRFLGLISMINLRSWFDRQLSGPNQPVVYWQEFMPNNPGDLRITVIGNRFAFGFWRKNRPNDFRASGSGRIDYDTPIPVSAIKYCISINDRLDFDSMAYDLLFAGDEFKVVEMSYGYVDSAIYRAPGYYELVGDVLVFRAGNYWPQEIWIKWGLQRIEAITAGIPGELAAVQHSLPQPDGSCS